MLVEEIKNRIDTKSPLDGLSPAVIAKHQSEVLDIWSGYQVSRALHVAAELGLSDQLASGEKSVAQLCEALSLHEGNLYRLMRLLSSYGIYQESEGKVFSQTIKSSFLVSAGELSMRDSMSMIDAPWWNSFGQLCESVRTGVASFEIVNDEKYFDFHISHPDSGAKFNKGMANYARFKNPHIVNAFDFSPYKKIVDVGGGTGALMSEILMRYKDAQGVLVDQAEVLENPVYIKEEGLVGRCELEVGSFFEGVPSGGDLYILQHILHDWPDEECLVILKNCCEAMVANTRLLIVDFVVPDDNFRHASKNSDVLMMALLSGKERSRGEFEGLVGQAGLELLNIKGTVGGLSVLEVGKK